MEESIHRSIYDVNNGLEILPNTLYKYYKSNKNFNKKRLSGEIFFSCPNNFNDVFDAQHEIINNIESVENSPTIYNKLNEIGYSDPLDIIEKLKGVEKDKYKIEVRKKQIENVGITCFTNNPLSVLMWAYYAENTGYCIEYDICKIRNNIEKLVETKLQEKGKVSTNRILANAVSYTHTLPCAPLFFQKGIKYQPLSKYFYKSKCWEHENEYRIVLSLLPNAVLKFDGAVKSITFGYNIEIDIAHSMLKHIITSKLNIDVYFLKKTKGYDGFEREKFPFANKDEIKNLRNNILSFKNL